ncbi:MAG TPA: CDP-alcohol phosphatidyltransferase family protein [Clostridia bacterium]|nr:CDP-alcohol phosphatidyltransferase family protein [Clostridia bacterium]
MTKEPKERVLNVPNALTMLRMVMVAVYLWLFFEERLYPALVVFLLASLTDVLDGYIARKYQLITAFGKLMDPLADKLMICAVLVTLALREWVPWWLIAVVAAKEIMMVLGGIFMLKRGVVVYAGTIGKAATGAFMLAIVVTFFHAHTSPVDLILQILALSLTLAAMFWYGERAIRRLRDANSGGKGNA